MYHSSFGSSHPSKLCISATHSPSSSSSPVKNHRHLCFLSPRRSRHLPSFSNLHESLQMASPTPPFSLLLRVMSLQLASLSLLQLVGDTTALLRLSAPAQDHDEQASSFSGSRRKTQPPRLHLLLLLVSLPFSSNLLHRRLPSSSASPDLCNLRLEASAVSDLRTNRLCFTSVHHLFHAAVAAPVPLHHRLLSARGKLHRDLPSPSSSVSISPFLVSSDQSVSAIFFSSHLKSRSFSGLIPLHPIRDVSLLQQAPFSSRLVSESIQQHHRRLQLAGNCRARRKLHQRS